MQHPPDAGQMAGIYDQAIAERAATFETQEAMRRWLLDQDHPVAVALAGGATAEVAGWASVSACRQRGCYSGGVLGGGRRGLGIGRVGGGGPEAAVPSVHLQRGEPGRTCGFREVGTHGRSDGR